MNKIKIECTENQFNYLIKIIYMASNDTNDSIKEFRDLFSNTVVRYAMSSIKDLFERTDPPRWRAGKGQEYYFVNEFLSVACRNENNIEIDSVLYKIGNYFERECDASLFAQKIREIYKGKVDKEVFK